MIRRIWCANKETKVISIFPRVDLSFWHCGKSKSLPTPSSRHFFDDPHDFENE
ncbi:hypothetical protein T07_6242 [Trichinella nelsoni]|uniref:Uncharacterized protein n=1 Tax=Trichinella nelsoni TaxID=6336 RepID=A0A0V0RAQ0_9BILA|nr:hypothetical protein T07_6242 [Trichinella nelsoni]